MIKCEECRAECCKEISVEIDKPVTIEDWDIIRWMVAHENVAVYQNHEGEWFVEFKTNCSKLNKENQCSIYKVRPKECRDYPMKDCLMNAPEAAEKIRFDTLEQVEKHIEEVVKAHMRMEKEKLDEWKMSS